MVGNFVRPSHGTEVKRVVTTDLVFPVVRQHLAVLFAIVPAGKVKVVEVQINAKFAGSSVHDAQAFRHDFFANAISGYHGNAVLGHEKTFWFKE
jgi:hypothetical protein